MPVLLSVRLSRLLTALFPSPQAAGASLLQLLVIFLLAAGLPTLSACDDKKGSKAKATEVEMTPCLSPPIEMLGDPVKARPPQPRDMGSSANKDAGTSSARDSGDLGPVPKRTDIGLPRPLEENAEQQEVGPCLSFAPEPLPKTRRRRRRRREGRVGPCLRIRRPRERSVKPCLDFPAPQEGDRASLELREESPEQLALARRELLQKLGQRLPPDVRARLDAEDDPS